MTWRLFYAFILPALLLFAASAAANTRLAIGTLGLAADNRDATLADLVASDLSAMPGFELVERRELDAVLKEASLSLSGLVRAKDAVHVGSLVRADQFLLGSSVRIQGTNSLVIRLVDAGSGAIRDVQVFRETTALETLARDIAQFARAASQHPPEGSRDYLAIGVIQNLGVNNRFADFPVQMRAYLTAHLSAKFTVLERDVVSFLANEVRMDQAGLTENHSGSTPQLQFGFWIVDGFYQSYEVAEPEVQLKLRIERILGSRESYTLQGKPEEALFKGICESIIHTLDHPAQPGPTLPPNREDELLALGNRAAQLVDYEPPDGIGTLPGRIKIRSAANPDKVMNTLEEATRAYESILLVAPEDTAAKMRLAACLLFDPKSWGGLERGKTQQRVTRAQEYYREVIAAAEPAYTTDAAVSLALSYGGLQGVDLLRRFGPDAPGEKNRKLVRDFGSHMLQRLAYVGPMEPLLPYFRAELMDDLRDIEANSNATLRVNFEPVLFPYRFRPQEREQVINELLPDLLTNFPDLGPYLLLEAAGEQVTSNSPVTVQFLSSLKQCEAHPESVRQPQSYFTHLSSTMEDEKEVKMHGGTTLLQRMFNLGAYVTLTNAVLARERAAVKGIAPPVTPRAKRLLADSLVALKEWKKALSLYNELPDISEQTKNECRKYLGVAAESEELPESAWKTQTDIRKVELAYQCIGRGQWPTALAILESMGHRTVRMNTGGAWGYAFTPVLPAVVADQCRAKAGKPKISDPMRFELSETPYVYFTHDGLPRVFAFEAEAEELWLATYSQIKRFHGPGPVAAGEPAELHELKRATRSGTTCISISPDFVWAGTQDDGLFELDRRTGTCRHFTMNEGLFLNGICALCLRGQTLWLGYQNVQNGAVGTLDLATHKFSAFTPALEPGAGTDSQPYYKQEKLDNLQQPPQFPVVAMTKVDPGEMWFAVPRKGVQRFRPVDNTWTNIGSRTDFHKDPRYIKTTPNGVREIGWLNLLSRPTTPFSAMAADPAQGLVLVTIRETLPLQNEASDQGGLILFDYRQNQAEWMQNREGLPANDLTAVALDGRVAWVGGRGFVAIVDVPTRQVVRIAYVSASRVQHIQLGKRYAWVQISCGKDMSEDAGDSWTGVYRVERASVEPRL